MARIRGCLRSLASVAMNTMFCCLVGIPGAAAQHMYLDVNGDAAPTTLDRVEPRGKTTMDIWLVTNVNRDGSVPSVATDSEPLSVFSYEFVVAAVGGTVSWGKYTNALKTVEFSYGRHESVNEIYIGAGGTNVNPPGKYKLGTLEFTVTSGDPHLEFRDRSSIYRGGQTAFGSLNVGKQWDNTLKYTTNRDRVGNGNPEEPGDWADADGLGRASAATEVLAVPLRFAAASPPAGPVPSLVVTLTRDGYLRVRIYDVRGRRVATVFDRSAVEKGRHTIDLSGRGIGTLASGVYFYRVEAAEGELQGRFVLLR